MADANDLRPSYTTSGQADKLLDLFRRVTPQKIDAKFLVDNGVTTAANASVVIRLAEWLGLVNKDGSVITEKVSKLKLVGDARNTYIVDLIKTSYKDLFDRVDMNTATRDDVSNYFVHNYAFGTAAAQQAALLFLHLCQTYGVPISEELKKKVYTHSGQPRAKQAARSASTRIGASATVEVGKPAETARKGSGVEITVRGFGIEANPHTSIIARNSEELEAKLKKGGEFDAFIEYVKILLKQQDSASKAGDAAEGE